MKTEVYTRFINKTKAAIEADPALRLAISLDAFAGSRDARAEGLDLVADYVRDVDVAKLSGTLRDDVFRLRRAQAILSDSTLVDGVAYSNLAINVRGASGNSISELVPDTQAREIVSRILAANPELAEQAAQRGPEIPL